jgi:hypothetical protein
MQVFIQSHHHTSAMSTGTEVAVHLFEKFPDIRYHAKMFSGSRFPCALTDGKTERLQTCLKLKQSPLITVVTLPSSPRNQLGLTQAGGRNCGHNRTHAQNAHNHRRCDAVIRDQAPPASPRSENSMSCQKYETPF